MTGDRMKMLMLTLPFMVLDLIAPDVIISAYVRVCTGMHWYVLLCTKYGRIYTRLTYTPGQVGTKKYQRVCPTM